MSTRLRPVVLGVGEQLVHCRIALTHSLEVAHAHVLRGAQLAEQGADRGRSIVAAGIIRGRSGGR